MSRRSGKAEADDWEARPETGGGHFERGGDSGISRHPMGVGTVYGKFAGIEVRTEGWRRAPLRNPVDPWDYAANIDVAGPKIIGECTQIGSAPMV